MKHPLLCIPLLALFVAVSIPATVEAKTFRTESHITKVSDHSITVELGHAKHTYKITAETQIHVDGKLAKAKALHKGMPADVTTSQINPKLALTIEAQTRS